MIDQAIEKINAEMQKDPSNRYMEIIGHYVIDRCTDDITAAKVCTEKKTLKGAMEAVTAKARKAKTGNVAVLLASDVFCEVDRYFGLPTDFVAQQKAMSVAAPGGAVSQPTPPPPAKLDLSLTDFF